MRHLITLFLIFIITPIATPAQSIGDFLTKQFGSNNLQSASAAQNELAQGHIDLALPLYAQAVAHAQSDRNAGRGVSGDLMAEYAYTLALHHDYEAALVNIDRARMLNAKHGDFFAAQILSLMGYLEPAKQLMQQAKIPSWINGIYQELNRTYAQVTSNIQDTPETALKRANRLAANGQTIQAIALFEELTTNYKDTPIVWIDYSTVWENLGYYNYASQLLQTGINCMPYEQKESKQVFSNHLATVKEKSVKYENPSWLKKLLGMNPPKMMLYVGASAAKDFYALNGRWGLYTSNKFSASLNVGANYANEKFAGSVGVSAYKAWGIFVGGLGITDQYSKDNNILSLTPSVGLSFLNKAQTSSFDITLSGYVPFSSEQKFSYSISIGKTIYFDLNGLLK